MRREIDQEIGKRASDALLSLVPVAICRELARAGKPQIFFVGFLDITHANLMLSIKEAEEESRKLGLKRESLDFPIFRYPRSVINALHEVQKNPKKEVSIDANEMFGKRGFTTECIANVYYAMHALPALAEEADKILMAKAGRPPD